MYIVVSAEQPLNINAALSARSPTTNDDISTEVIPDPLNILSKKRVLVVSQVERSRCLESEEQFLNTPVICVTALVLIRHRPVICVRDVNPFYHFEILPGFHVPSWAKGAVIYQIFVDRFCNGDTTNDVEDREYYYIGDSSVQVKNWFQYPSNMDVRSFYGGDLQGVWDKLDYLQELGVEVIYFNPLFVSPSNHKYDIQDYDHIDPHFGKIVDDRGELLKEDQFENRLATKYINRVTNKANLEASDALFAKVVSEAHKRGMKVIMDGVFNHCGSFNKWLDRERIYENAKGYDKGAYVDEKSPYRNYFHFYNDNQWPYNPSYDGWWGHDTLPKLNFEASKELTDYILYIGKKWVSAPYNADGWRLDVAADLGRSPEFNHNFWKQFRKAVKEANPNAIILAEHRI